MRVHKRRAPPSPQRPANPERDRQDREYYRCQAKPGIGRRRRQELRPHEKQEQVSGHDSNKPAHPGVNASIRMHGSRAQPLKGIEISRRISEKLARLPVDLSRDLRADNLPVGDGLPFLGQQLGGGLTRTVSWFWGARYRRVSPISYLPKAVNTPASQRPE